MSDFLGTWTLAKIVSAVQNNLEAGMKTSNGYPFSIEQLEHTVIAVRNELYEKQKLNGQLNKFGMMQEINCIPLDCESLSLCCDPSKQTALHFILPNYLELDFIGTPHRTIEFKIYTDEMWNYHQYRNQALRNRPYVWLRRKDGVNHGFLINPPTFNIEYISASMILENPFEVNRYGCCPLNPETDRFPVSPEMVNMIINEITSNWANWYYRFSKYNANSQI
jgi:hypothetical protein